MIKIENLKKTYDRRSRNANPVLRGISFDLPDTGFVCILGASGCGKTTLLNAIGGLDSFDSGRILTDTADIRRSGSRTMEDERNASFGYIFQNYYLLSEHSAAYNVFLGMHSMPLSKKEKMQRVHDALETVDMLRYKKRSVGNLSGGQQQRVAIARAIARQPKVIFADEPTGNLDEANTMNICSILKELSRESLVVMVTHEERVAKFFADRIITLEDGSIISDTDEWTRGTMEAGEKDAIYSGEYSEERLESGGVSLRVLQKDGAEPVSLSVVVEGDRIVIKSLDQRVILASSENVSPKIIEGVRPVICAESFKPSAKKPRAENKAPAENAKAKKGLGFAFLMQEASSLISGKKLRKFSTGLFIVLLSLMIALGISDILSVSHIDLESFISTDSHILEFSFARGPSLPREEWVLTPYREAYMNYLDASGLDFDYIPKGTLLLEYSDSTVPQLGSMSATFGNYSYVNKNRLDPDTLIYGRMPESFDEIVLDRWVVDKMLEKNGVIQNVVPNASYLVGKQLTLDKKTFTPTVVGICDSGEPAVYISYEAMLSIGVGGTEVITLSDFRDQTGYTGLDSLAADECIVLTDTAGIYYKECIGGIYSPSSGYLFTIRDAVEGTKNTVSAKFVVADDAMPQIFRTMVRSNVSFSLWCTDKQAMYDYLDSTPLPRELKGMLDIGVRDKYALAYEKNAEKIAEKVDSRAIVTVTLLSLSLVMLYLMQRSKIKERMDLVAVYRLLGIPKHNLMFIFAAESIILTMKYAIPTLLAVWLGVRILSLVELIGDVMIFPLWAAGLTLAAILAVRVIIAVLPILRLLSKPPARLASQHDF